MSLSPARFTGGIATRGGLHASGPFGVLEFDERELSIRGVGLAKWIGLRGVRASRGETQAIRLSTGALAVRVSIIRADGTEVEPYFAASQRGRVRQALIERNWPIVEDRWNFGLRGKQASGEGDATAADPAERRKRTAFKWLSRAVGVGGLVLLAFIWTRPLHATVSGVVYDCGTVASSPMHYNQFPAKLGSEAGRACQHASNRQFFEGWVVAVIGGPLGFALRLGAQRGSRRE